MEVALRMRPCATLLFRIFANDNGGEVSVSDCGLSPRFG